MHIPFTALYKLFPDCDIRVCFDFTAGLFDFKMIMKW